MTPWLTAMSGGLVIFTNKDLVLLKNTKHCNFDEEQRGAGGGERTVRPRDSRNKIKGRRWLSDDTEGEGGRERAGQGMQNRMLRDALQANFIIYLPINLGFF